MAAAVFLDRDGTIIEDAHYPRDPAVVKLLPNAVAGMKRMREKGYYLFVVSNQSGVGRGIISMPEFKAVHKRVCELLQAEAVEIAEFGYCFHTPEEGCGCRKPQTGLLPREYQGYPLDWTKSFTIGDKTSDAELGRKMGGTGCLLSSNDADGYPHYRDLLALAEALPNAP